jgi:nucleoside-triphosphatase
MILLTAKPRIGKSTVIKKLINIVGIDNCVGFYSEEIHEDGERVGFQIKTVCGKCKVFARIGLESNNYKGRYGVDISAFEAVCLDEFNKVLVDGAEEKIIFIDEIGPMQMYSEAFKENLIQLADSRKLVIGTVFYEEYPWIDDLKTRKDVDMIEITKENRDTIAEQIMSLILVNGEHSYDKAFKGENK